MILYFMLTISIMFMIFLFFREKMNKSNPFLATKIELVEQRPYKAILLYKGSLGAIHNGELSAQIEYMPGEFVVKQNLKFIENTISPNILNQLNLKKIYYTVTDPSLDAFGRLVYDLNIFAYAKKE